MISSAASKQFVRRRSDLLSVSIRLEALGILVLLCCLCSLRLGNDISFGYQEGLVIMKPSQEHTLHLGLNTSIDSKKVLLYSLLARDSLKQRDSRHRRPTQRPELTDKYLDRFIVVPEYKLLFCHVEKVGCSMFNHLFRMLRLLHPNLYLDDKKLEARFQAESHFSRNTPEHHNLTKSDLEDILADPMWTKAVFFRDPATRFLSAYRSKCMLQEDAYKGADHCRLAFGPPMVPWKQSVSFDRAIVMLDQHSDQVFGDEHFAPASLFCGGLENTLDYYDFVHQLTSQTSPDHIRRLFSIIGVRSNTSDYLIQNVVKTGGTAADRDQELLQDLYYPNGGLPLKASMNQRKEHITGSNQGSVLEDSYGRTQRGLQVIHERYRKDYDVFGLPRLTLREMEEARV